MNRQLIAKKKKQQQQMINRYTLKMLNLGCPWWLSGEEVLNLWSRKIPHAWSN